MQLHIVSKVAVSAVALSVLAGCPAKRVPCTDSAALMTARAPHEKFLKVANAVPGEYVVVLKAPEAGLQAQSVRAAVQGLAAKYELTAFQVYEHALRGFATRMSEGQALALSADPAVEYVQQNGIVHISDNQANVTWGIDRVDQRELPLDKSFLFEASGKGVHAYIIDTGIRISHHEFGGRAKYAFDAVDSSTKGEDCHGHGTHVAGTVGGNTYGVAKNVNLYAVRVLDCKGSGTTAGVVAGVDWVTRNRQLPAVANMSLGGDADQAIDDAVRRSIASGVVYTIAAGNEDTDACKKSPARTREALTVGATTSSDSRATFSNWGSCVDVFAPGNKILSAWHYGDSETRELSGTSMAAPHVAGVAALYLERNPSAAPDAVAAALLENSTPDKVADAQCAPNKLTYSGFIDGRSLQAPTVKAGEGAKTPATADGNTR
jgi:subtilisin family serine protease